jgi:hypothetical protein
MLKKSGIATSNNFFISFFLLYRSHAQSIGSLFGRSGTQGAGPEGPEKHFQTNQNFAVDAAAGRNPCAGWEVNEHDEPPFEVVPLHHADHTQLRATPRMYASPYQDLEKVYKNNVLFSKFILLISKGDSYEDLIKNRNEDILREQCRNWNNSVSCTFDSSPVFTEIEEQMSKVDTILGEMDIRGKINQIDAQKRFHLI